MPKITVEACECTRCGHVWLPSKNGPPIACARCKSPYWNIERGVQPRGRQVGYRKPKKPAPKRKEKVKK